MKHKTLSLLSLMVVVLLIAACAPRSQAGSGAVEDQATLMEALRAAGVDVELGDSVEQAFFSVTGQIVKVNGADAQVFEYKSVEAMEVEAAQVSADGGSVGTSMVTWMSTPHFFKAGRILVLYVGDDQVVLDLLKGALGAQFAGR